jgi:hypothetical protein
MKYCLVEDVKRNTWSSCDHPVYFYIKDGEMASMFGWLDNVPPKVFNSKKEVRDYIENDIKKTTFHATTWKIVPADDILLYLAERKLRAT